MKTKKSMKWDREIYLLNVDGLKTEIRELTENKSTEQRFSIRDFIDRLPTIQSRI